MAQLLDTKTLQARYTPREQGKPLTLDRQLCQIRFSPDGKLLVGGDFEGNVCRWDAAGALKPITPHLSGQHHGWVQALAFHPGEGKLLFTADSWGKLCCWPITEKAPRPVWSVEKAHPGWIRRLAVSPDGKSLASCSGDGLVRLWSTARGEKIREWPSAGGLDVLSLAVHPDGKSLAFGDLKGVIHQHDLASGKLMRRFEVKEMYRLDRIQDVGGVRCLAFDPTGATLAAGGCQPTTGGFVQGSALLAFFEAATGKLVQSLKVGGTNEGYVYDLQYHPTAGFVMAVTSGQPGVGKLLFHRPGDAQPFWQTPRMPNCHSLAVHGRRLVVAATNANSAGNGRPTTKDNRYPGNSSPLFTWEMPPAA